MDFKKIFLFKEMMLIATTKPSFNITSGYPWEFLQMPSNPIMKSPLTWLLVVTLGSASGGHVPGTTLNGTLNLVYLFPFMGSVGTLPAISVAVKEIHRRELLLDYAIDWQLWDSGCNSYTGKALFELNSRIYNILKLTSETCFAVVFSQSIEVRCWLREWRCRRSSADRRCPNYILLINNFIA